MGSNLISAGIFLIQVLFGLYLFFLILRFVLQASRADFYNPVCQAIIRITDPVVKPLRTFIPSWRAIDFATLVASLVLQLVMISLITLMLGGPIFHSIFLAWSFVGLLSTLIDIYFFALIIMIIASWIAPYNNHPALMLIYQITEPLCRPARRLIPPMGGLDFSVMIVILALILFDQYLVIRPLAEALGMPKGLILGL